MSKAAARRIGAAPQVVNREAATTTPMSASTVTWTRVFA